MYAEAVGRKIDVSNEMSWGSGKDMDCTEGEAAKIDGSWVSSVLGAHRDSRIEGLGDTRGLTGSGDGVRVLGVDSVTDDSSDVVGSVSGERMGEGPGKGGGTDLTGETGNSEDTTERLATDLGSGIFLVHRNAILRGPVGK